MVKHVDTAVETSIQELINGTWGATQIELGLKQNGVGITNMTYTQTAANAIYKGTTTRYEEVMMLKQAIINGTIVVPTAFATNGGFLPVSSVPVFFGIFLAAIVADRRRRRN